MSVEALHSPETNIPIQTSTPKLERYLYAVPEQPTGEEEFNIRSYFDKVSRPETDELKVLEFVFEGLGVIRSSPEADPEEEVARQVVLKKVTEMQAYFRANFLDSSSKTGYDRARFSELHEKSDMYGKDDYVMSALDTLRGRARAKVDLQGYAESINRGDAVYRLLLLEMHGQRLSFMDEKAE